MSSTATTTPLAGGRSTTERRGFAERDSGEIARRLEHHRSELTAFCAGRLRSRSEAEDAVQETLIRAWRGYDRLRSPSALRGWLYRIAGNVCIDVLGSPQRRALPMDLGGAPGSEVTGGSHVARSDGTVRGAGRPLAPRHAGDPADAVAARDEVRLAVVRLHHLPARQRAVLVLCEVLRWQATEAADLLGTTVASVTSALQRARATLATVEASGQERSVRDRTIPDDVLSLYVDAFDDHDVGWLVSMVRGGVAGGPAPVGPGGG